MAHTYIPTNWINKKTQLNADNMNKIEEELARLARESGGITEILEGPGINVTTSDSSSVIVGLKTGSSEDNLLVLDKDNGLILTLSLGYDPETRKLVLSSGSGWSSSVEFDVDRAVVDGNYDPETKNIVLTLSDDTEVIIDMSKMKLNWKFIESSSIIITEDFDDDGLSTFKLECRISEDERNEITIKDDGLFSERLDWNNLGISDETDGRWEFEGVIGFKYWFFESSKSVNIDTCTLEGKSGNLDYYNFGYRISTEKGNVLEIRNGKLYIPDEIPEEAKLRQELERMTEEYESLKSIKFRSSGSVKFIDKVDPDTDMRYIKADIKVSEYLGNEIVINKDGVMIPPYTPGPGKPDLTPYVNRLKELEKEYPRSSREVDYFKTSINI